MPPISPRSALTRRLSLYIWGLFLVLLLLLSALGYAALHLSAGKIVPLVLQQMVQLKAEASEKLGDRARALAVAKSLAAEPAQLDEAQKKRVKELLLRLR